jgi:hypothetical protein
MPPLLRFFLWETDADISDVCYKTETESVLAILFYMLYGFYNLNVCGKQQQHRSLLCFNHVILFRRHVILLEHFIQ